MKNVLVAPGKYIQGRGVLKEIGQWAGCLGHNAVVLWSPGRRRAVGQIVEASLAEADLTMREVEFGGESTRQEAARVAAFAKDAGADVMIGIGGGKALDTAKAAAAEVGCRMMTCPTIASNDTPTSAATVWYDADGNFEGFECWPFNPDIVLVDSQVVVDGPIQTFAAGMGDALATWVEAEASYKTRAINLAGGVATQAAMAIAELAYTNLMAYGLEARRAAEQHLVTPAVERIIETNVLLSGLGFESGGLATAHMIANPLSNFPECKHAMHGEKVSFGIITQLCLDEDTDTTTMHEIYDFLIAIGLPVTFAELNLRGIRREQLKPIGDVCAGEGSLCANHCFDVTGDGVVDAMLAADLLGRERLALAQR